LTHRSVSADDPARNDNERLEFLGDAVLQLVITDHLYDRYPHLAEGQMAKVRAAVVSKPALAEIARTLDLGRHVELAPGEERTGGRSKDSILANALEAILGAVYLDGGLEAAATVISGLWDAKVEERARRPGVRDFKTRLQEMLARQGLRPVYLIDASGPDHERRFQARVVIDGSVLGLGEGRSKKDAEQESARVALEALDQS
jgi:ribonuclease-3